jgi:excisionase family DNA binding protein
VDATPTQDHDLSTGEAARLCSVTPDTVLKWVKSGRLPARRTIGGHYRIDPADLARVNVPPSPPTAAGSSSPRFSYCWDYNAEGGRVRERCAECAVYRTRALRCYEVAKIFGDEHTKFCCKESCETCDYYRRVHLQRTNVLVVTDNDVLTAVLRREGSAAPFNVETTDCEYSCSAIVDRFRPDFTVVDCSLGQQRTQDICAHLLQDPRIPLVRIILAGKAGEFPVDCDRAIFARMFSPFGVDDIAECLRGLGEPERGEATGVGGDAARA